VPKRWPPNWNNLLELFGDRCDRAVGQKPVKQNPQKKKKKKKETPAPDRRAKTRIN